MSSVSRCVLSLSHESLYSVQRRLDFGGEFNSLTPLIYHVCLDRHVVALFGYISKIVPRCSGLLVARQSSVSFYPWHFKHRKDSVLFPGSVKLNQQEPQKSATDSKGSPKVLHVTSRTDTPTPEGALSSLYASHKR